MIYQFVRNTHEDSILNIFVYNTASHFLCRIANYLCSFFYFIYSDPYTRLAIKNYCDFLIAFLIMGTQAIEL